MSEEMQNGTVREQEDGQITYATEVISTIVSVATTEVEGISGIAGGGSISGILGKGRAPRGVKVDLNGNRVSVDISVAVDYGIPIQKVGRNCQENVRKSIETMTGLTVERVDLHVVSVSFEKENQEMQQSQKLALRIEEQEEQSDEKSADATSSDMAEADKMPRQETEEIESSEGDAPESAPAGEDRDNEANETEPMNGDD